MKRIIIVALLFSVLISCGQERTFTTEQEQLFTEASQNGPLVNEGFNRCVKFVDAWLEIADSATGLIPRNINDTKSKDIWNAKDCAADNYPFMVLTSALLRHDLYKGIMREMLETETRLTSRVGSMPDTYSFSKKGFAVADTVMSEIIFGSANI